MSFKFIFLILLAFSDYSWGFNSKKCFDKVIKQGGGGNMIDLPFTSVTAEVSYVSSF